MGVHAKSATTEECIQPTHLAIDSANIPCAAIGHGAKSYRDEGDGEKSGANWPNRDKLGRRGNK